MLLTLWLLCILPSTQAGAACPNPAAMGSDPAGRHLTQAGRRAVLAEVDHLVRTRALDASFGGQNWAKVFGRTRIQALSAPDDRGFYRALRTLTIGLGDGQLTFLSPATWPRKTAPPETTWPAAHMVRWAW